MDRTIDAPSDRRTASPGRSCPLCGEQIRDSEYPRHRITLEDESDTVPTQLVNGQLCHDCWNDLYTDLTAAD